MSASENKLEGQLTIQDVEDFYKASKDPGAGEALERFVNWSYSEKLHFLSLINDTELMQTMIETMSKLGSNESVTLANGDIVVSRICLETTTEQSADKSVSAAASTIYKQTTTCEETTSTLGMKTTYTTGATYETDFSKIINVITYNQAHVNFNPALWVTNEGVDGDPYFDNTRLFVRGEFEVASVGVLGALSYTLWHDMDINAKGEGTCLHYIP